MTTIKKIEATKNYDVKRYQDNEIIGNIDLTDAQFRRYMALTQQPQGLIRLGAMPHDLYDLFPEFQDQHEDTTIWLD